MSLSPSVKKEESSTGGQSRNSSAGSSNKSSKSTKSTRFELDDPTPGIDSNNLESSNAKSEQLANALEYLKLGLDLTNTMEVEDHLREKRFALNQMWALFSALHHCCETIEALAKSGESVADPRVSPPEKVMIHAEEAVAALENHITDPVVRRYNHKATEKGRLSLSELASQDVEEEDERAGEFFNIKDGGRYKNWTPSL